jgi:hypothetical protein
LGYAEVTGVSEEVNMDCVAEHRTRLSESRRKRTGCKDC